MDKLEKIPRYKKDMPHKPIYGTDFLDELKANWGEEWGIKYLLTERFGRSWFAGRARSKRTP